MKSSGGSRGNRGLEIDDLTVLTEPVELAAEVLDGDLHLQPGSGSNLVIDEDSRPTQWPEDLVAHGRRKLHRLFGGSRRRAHSAARAESSSQDEDGAASSPSRCSGARLGRIPSLSSGAQPWGWFRSPRHG